MITRLLAAFGIVGLVLTAAACSSPTRPSDTPIIAFSISPTSGPIGTLVTLTWNVTPSDTRIAITASAGVNPGTGFPAVGSTTATPATTTIYTLTGTNPRTGMQSNTTQTFAVR